jgi:hypothetical protein
MKTETKTIREALGELHEPYRQKAFKAFEDQFPENKHMLEIEVGNTADALSAAFVWDRTAEGNEYWQDLYISLIS